jgi:uncharacterized membrane protein/thiol-disulfide isomerase/thioredoxin
MSPTLPFLLALAVTGATAPMCASAQEAVVRTVLFYSPTCPHCHKVMTEDLPPLADRYGDRLVIVGVDVSSRGGQALLQATADHFGIPQGDVGVPLMVAGEEVMIGSVEIPERLPGIIERALAGEGVDWPQVGALRESLAAQGLLEEEPEPAADTPATDTPAREPEEPAAAPAEVAPARSADTLAASGATTPAESPAESPAEPSTDPPVPEAPAAESAPTGVTRSLTPGGMDDRPSVVDRLLRDPLGNGVAIVVLLGLVLSLGVAVRLARAPLDGRAPVPSWVVPLLSVVGMGVAAYLSFVEVTGQSAVCGPVGDCNAVQQSPYARLFGILPVGMLGLFGYAAILAAWSLGRRGPPAARDSALRFRWAMAFAATAFSVYLTFLEPFVIGATCMWCITSAVVIAVLLLVTTAELRRPAAR